MKNAQIVAPLTNQLQKEDFAWYGMAHQALAKIKEALVTVIVLIYPNVVESFILETNTCDVGIGVILLQREYQIAYFSKKLSLLRQGALMY